jgi:nitroimidazol reductase NimA-like FMN-containing flavoprotein (pyridoxamine 5'-phosphate oxidase superfamily)
MTPASIPETRESLQTPRTTVKRLPKRAAYDRATVDAILDEGRVCHVGFAVDGQPFVLPTVYARIDTTLYFHGSAASRMLGEVGAGIPCCLTVTHLDGLVLARSAFHHSVNYRSVVVLGVARLVADPAEKLAALRSIVDHVVPERWSEVREPLPQEVKATSVLALPIEEASAKIRRGDPIDDEEDYARPVWAGTIPFALTAGKAIADARLPRGTPFSASVARIVAASKREAQGR